MPRILIIRLGAFGDIIHTLPLAYDLHQAGYQVDWVCDQPWQIVLENNPVIHRCFSIPRKQWKRKTAWIDGTILNGIVQLRQALRERDYDVVIDAQGRSKSALAALLSGARLRVSHDASMAREGAAWISHRQVPGSATHIVDNIRNLALPLIAGQQGAQWQFPLPAWQEEKSWARAFYAAEQIEHAWIWNVGTTWPTKQWPRELQSAFLSLLCDQGRRVMIVYGPGWEAKLAQQLHQQEPRSILAPQTSLPQLAGLISQAEIFISADTGPLHLAMALGVPALGLFGPVPAERNGPRGKGYRNIQAPGKLWERRDVSKVHMSKIKPQQVYAEALRCLADVQ